MQESVLSINKFEEPKLVKDNNALCLLIMRLLMLEKGSMELHPEMGVGLVSTYRYSFIDELDTLQLEISNQIATYITKSSDINVQLDVKDKCLFISIKIKDNLFVFNFDSQNNTIKLSDL